MNMSVYHKMIYKQNAIPIKISKELFGEYNKLILKLIWKTYEKMLYVTSHQRNAN